MSTNVKNASQYQLSPSAAVSHATIALELAQADAKRQRDKLREVYSFPVRTGFFWFKKERPATEAEIDARLRSAESQFSDEFDHAFVPIWRVEGHAEAMQKLIAAAQLPGVQVVMASQRDMDIINLYAS